MSGRPLFTSLLNRSSKRSIRLCICKNDVVDVVKISERYGVDSYKGLTEKGWMDGLDKMKKKIINNINFPVRSRRPCSNFIFSFCFFFVYIFCCIAAYDVNLFISPSVCLILFCPV